MCQTILATHGRGRKLPPRNGRHHLTNSPVTYYLLSARELEEHYLSQQVQTISRGGDFADRKAVSLEIGGARITRRMKLLPRLIRGEWTSYVVIFVFIAVYIGSFFQV